MVGGSSDEGKAKGGVDSFFEGFELERDKPLVMIEGGHNDFRLVESSAEDNIGWIRTFNSHPFFTGMGNSRDNLLFFL